MVGSDGIVDCELQEARWVCRATQYQQVDVALSKLEGSGNMRLLPANFDDKTALSQIPNGTGTWKARKWPLHVCLNGVEALRMIAGEDNLATT